MPNLALKLAFRDFSSRDESLSCDTKGHFERNVIIICFQCDRERRGCVRVLKAAIRLRNWRVAINLQCKVPPDEVTPARPQGIIPGL